MNDPIPAKNPATVHDLVDKWRRESSVVSPERTEAPPPSSEPASPWTPLDPLPDTSVHVDADGDTDMVPSSFGREVSPPKALESNGLPSPSSECEVSQQLRRETVPMTPPHPSRGTPELVFAGDSRPLSPPTHDLPRSPTPPRLNVEDKTALLIARIRTQATQAAAATRTSSDGEFSPPRSLDSDSDDEIFDRGLGEQRNRYV